MPGAQRKIDPGLIDQLRDAPYRFEFFQAVRTLLAHYRMRENAPPDQDLLGQVICFRNSLSLGFPPSEIESLTFDAAVADEAGASHAGKVSITPSFIGLTGPMGVLPRHYTQHVAERELWHGDTATRAFLDIFTSRATALFYQAWLKCRLHLQYEADRHNRFLPMVLSLAGFDLHGRRRNWRVSGQEIADDSLAWFAAALRTRPQSAQWLACVVAEYFSVQCTAEQFVGQWLTLPASLRTRLGADNCVLDASAFCGERTWDRTCRIRLVIGPLRRAKFEEFLPGGAAAPGLRRLVRMMAGAGNDCELRLVLDRRDLVQASLGVGDGSTRLGWNGWLGKRAGGMEGAASDDSREVAWLIMPGATDDSST